MDRGIKGTGNCENDQFRIDNCLCLASTGHSKTLLELFVSALFWLGLEDFCFASSLESPPLALLLLPCLGVMRRLFQPTPRCILALFPARVTWSLCGRNWLGSPVFLHLAPLFDETLLNRVPVDVVVDQSLDDHNNWTHLSDFDNHNENTYFQILVHAGFNRSKLLGGSGHSVYACSDVVSEVLEAEWHKLDHLDYLRRSRQRVVKHGEILEHLNGLVSDLLQDTHGVDAIGLQSLIVELVTFRAGRDFLHGEGRGKPLALNCRLNTNLSQDVIGLLVKFLDTDCHLAILANTGKGNKRNKEECKYQWHTQFVPINCRDSAFSCVSMLRSHSPHLIGSL